METLELTFDCDSAVPVPPNVSNFNLEWTFLGELAPLSTLPLSDRLFIENPLFLIGKSSKLDS